MKKIAILGAGVGGLALASLLDETKYTISVYEKKSSSEELGYFWHDDVDLTKLKSWDFDFKINNHDENWNIYSCSGNRQSFVSNKDEIAPLNRKKLSDELFNGSIKKSKIYFNSEVTFVDDLAFVNGEILDDYDLIIDCRGCLQTNLKQIFTAARIIVNNSQNIVERNVFLKPCNIKGVAWCNFNQDGTDILIGEVGEFHNDKIRDILNFFEDKLSVEVNFESIDYNLYKIPVKYPSSSFFKKNYVILGDIANMTVPMIGSGIVNTMEAAYILADILNNNILSNNVEDLNKLLWQYQYIYFKNKAVDATQIDIFKNWLLSTKETNVDFLFEKNIITSEDLNNIMTGNFINCDIKTLLEKAKRLKSDLILTFELTYTLSKALMIKNVINNMPEDYDESRVLKWEKSFEKILKK